MQERALALIDGEHYPQVVRDALADLPYAVVAAVMLGGTEKLSGDAEYGVPLHPTVEEALETVRPDVVVDLSDEPVVDTRERFRLASRALAAGARYVGADFHFDPVRFAPFELPALAVIGSGKRVGKTAVSGHLARLLADENDVLVVAMGRGGPVDPVLVGTPPDVEDLLALSRAGWHAASDYLEDAVLARVATIGCRRCGGGLAGMPFTSNVEAAAREAAARRPDLVIFEGSGAAVPPVEVGASVLVAGASQDAESVAGFLGAYRLLLSDLVVLTMCESPLASQTDVQQVRESIAAVAGDLPVVATVLRPRPSASIEGRRVAFFATAVETVHARLRLHLEGEHGADVVLVSGNLARRSELRRDLEAAEARAADVYLVEIKAAAIDVVAEAAAARGVDVVFADNAVVPLDGEPDLDERLLALARGCMEQVAA
jgi:cyclic 2,3-diphosphoglycerate synthetase